MSWIERENEKMTERYKELGVERRRGGDRGLDARHAGQARREGRQDARRSRRPGRRRAASRSLGKDALDEDEANAMIMAARAHWFADEAGAAEETKTA